MSGESGTIVSSDDKGTLNVIAQMNLGRNRPSFEIRKMMWRRLTRLSIRDEKNPFQGMTMVVTRAQRLGLSTRNLKMIWPKQRKGWSIFASGSSMR